MKTSIETRMLAYGLRLGIAYQVYQSISALVKFGFHTTTLVSSSIMLVILSMYLFRQRINLQLNAFLFHLIALPGFVYFWLHYGGFSGTVPVFLCLYIPFILVVTRGVYLFIVMALYTLVFGTLIFYPGIFDIVYPQKTIVDHLQRDLDFILICGMAAYFFVILKNEFMFYRNEITRNNKRLDKWVNMLDEQNVNLKKKQTEIESINDNLESLVLEHTLAIEQKNRQLSEYAFINAHLVRAPLCRVMGLTHLIELESGVHQRPDLQQIRQIAAEIDTIIRKINATVS